MRVVISGLGVLSPLGPDRETSWQQLLAGNPPLQNGPSPAASSRDSSSPPPFPGFAVADAWLPSTPGWTRQEQMAVQIAREALQDAGWDPTAVPRPERWGCVVGSSKGALQEYARFREPPGETLTTSEEPLFPQLWPGGVASRLVQEFGLRGPILSPVAACATGLDAVLRGVRLIEQGDCDYVLAGSVDASLHPLVLHSYRRLGILADRKWPLAEACRPFDRDRSGFVLGEGGALVVLSRAGLESAAERGYAHWLAGDSGSDPTGLTQLDLEATSLIRLLGQVLIRSGLSTRDIDCLQLHGTATHANDLAEARALARVFGSAAEQPLCTASKGAHGHALGAAGSLELAWLLLSLRDGVIPAVHNLAHLDPACPLRCVQGAPLERPLQVGGKVSLGFGGHQVVCLLERGPRPATNV